MFQIMPWNTDLTFKKIIVQYEYGMHKNILKIYFKVSYILAVYHFIFPYKYKDQTSLSI